MEMSERVAEARTTSKAIHGLDNRNRSHASDLDQSDQSGGNMIHGSRGRVLQSLLNSLNSSMGGDRA